jgi:predicted nucleotide-binding protein
MIMSVLERFTAPEGRRLLIEAFCNQSIVGGERQIAERLASVCVVEEFAHDARFIEQGASDNDILFLLSGSAAIIINGREVTRRSAGQHVGEMALIDVSARRMATVVACEDTVIARVAEPEFTKVANEFPSIWRRMAIQIGTRLRERSKFIKEPNPQPHLFIGSSRESLPVATKIKNGLSNHPLSIYLWTEEIFTPSDTNIEALEHELERADFSILVLGPDDKIFSRGKDADGPRDNVIFELGLFMGALTRQRTFFVVPRGADLKIPTDLGGVTPLAYSEDDIDDLCATASKLIAGLGPK